MSDNESSSLTEARRAVACASALWADGLTSEAHGFMVAALRAELRAWAPADATSESDDGAVETRALDALERSGYRHIDRLRQALAVPVPAVGAPAPPDFERIWSEAERLLGFSARRLRSPAARKRSRIRIAVAGGAGLLVVVAFMVRLWTGPHATASAVISSEHPASHAVDGGETTEWILPDRTPGWLQITFRSPRRVRSVRIINGHNRHYMDRAAQQVRVTAFSAAGPVGTAEGRFGGISEKRSALDLPIDARDVTHLRVEVLSHFGAGGALAEVEVR